MSKTYRTTGSGAQQTLHEIEDEKIPVYDTLTDAEADLANLAEGQIVGTKDAGTDEQTLIEYVDGRLETITTEIAMDTFKTGSKAQLYKSGNNVQFRYYVEGNSTFNPIAENTWATIGTIPEGLRPKSRIEAGMQGGLGGTLGLYAIDTTGAVQVFHYSNTGWAAVFAIQCDYNVDGTNSHGMTVNTLKDAKDYTDAQLAGKVTERNITSTVATSTMDYFAAIKAILDSIDFSTWENKTYAGKFTSNGQAPNQWNGSYQLSKVSNLDYGITILGNANNHSFTGIWENATNGWKIIMDGETLVYNNNGLLVTSSENNRRFRFVCNRAPFNLVGAQLQAYNLWGRQALGRVGMEMNANLTYQDVDLLTLTNNTYNWPAGNTFWWSNPTFQPADTSASVWPMYAQNDNHFYRIELWGIAWDQSYISGGFEFVL